MKFNKGDRVKVKKVNMPPIHRETIGMVGTVVGTKRRLGYKWYYVELDGEPPLLSTYAYLENEIQKWTDES